jgi:hypothetical protein
MIDLEIFKEISIGGQETESLVQRLINAGVQFNEYATFLFKHRSFCPGRQLEKVRLVKMSLSEFTLK